MLPEKRKRGRPVAKIRKERVSFRLPVPILTVMCREALRRDVSVGVIAREYLLSAFIQRT